MDDGYLKFEYKNFVYTFTPFIFSIWMILGTYVGMELNSKRCRQGSKQHMDNEACVGFMSHIMDLLE